MRGRLGIVVGMLPILVGAVACDGGSGEEDAGGAGDADVLDVVVEAEDAPVEVVGEADAGGDGDVEEDAGDAADGEVDGGEYVPTPGDVDLEVVNPIPGGEVILYGDWASEPNAIRAIRPDGTGLIDVLHIARAWSLGVSHGGDRVAFSGARYFEGERYGIPTFGDAIQYTWLLEVETGAVRLLAGGNVNDECHAFAPDDGSVLLCRRWDFRMDGGSIAYEGYGMFRIDVETGVAERLGDPGMQSLSPQLSPDGATLYYTQFEYVGGSPRFRVVARDLSDGSETLVRDRARGWSFSPDGTRVLFRDLADGSRLHVIGVDGTGDVAVTSAAAQGGSFSPDGTRLVYERPEGSAGCTHLEIVSADGSDAAAPFRLRSCGDAGESITFAAWMRRP